MERIGVVLCEELYLGECTTRAAIVFHNTSVCYFHPLSKLSIRHLLSPYPKKVVPNLKELVVFQMFIT